jgi:hypothetical protein
MLAARRAVARVAPLRAALRASTSVHLASGGGHHEDHTMEPPFHRLPLPNRPVRRRSGALGREPVRERARGGMEGAAS